MVRFRRRASVCAAIWLLCQLVWVSVIVPHECCRIDGRQPAAVEAHCHETAPPAPECTLRGTCYGPAAALLSMLSNPGILPPSAVPAPVFTRIASVPPAREQVMALVRPPAAPPPRG
jgi:hypothetical protein